MRKTREKTEFGNDAVIRRAANGKTKFERFNAVAERDNFCMRKTREKRSSETVLQYGGRQTGKLSLKDLTQLPNAVTFAFAIRGGKRSLETVL